MIYFRFNHTTHPPKIDLRPNVWKANYSQMQAAAYAANWSVPPRIGEHWTSFARTFVYVKTLLLSVCGVKPWYNFSSWLYQTAKRLLPRRHRARRFYYHGLSKFNCQMYKCRRNQRVTREARRCYEERLVWGAYLNQCCRATPNRPHIQAQDGRTQ